MRYTLHPRKGLVSGVGTVEKSENHQQESIGLTGSMNLGHCVGTLQEDSGKLSPFTSLSPPAHDMKSFVLSHVPDIMQHPHPKQQDQPIVKCHLQSVRQREYLME